MISLHVSEGPLGGPLVHNERAERYSAWWDRDRDDVLEFDRGEATLIDHVLLSTALAAQSAETQ